MRTGLAVRLYKSYSSMTLLADLTGRWTQLSYSTALHGGFRDCTMFIPMGLSEAWLYMQREAQPGRHFTHLLIQEGYETRWEGRVTSCGIEWGGGQLGLSLTALGYWSSLRDKRVTTIDYSAGTNTVDSIIKAMLTAKCPDINADQSGIESVAGNVNMTLLVDSYPQVHILNALAPLGDSAGNVHYAAVWEDRKFYYQARSVSVVDWEVRLRDIAQGSIVQGAEQLRNAGDAYDGTTRTTTATDTESVTLHGVTRDAVVSVPSGTTMARAGDARDRMIAERKEPQQTSTFTIGGDPIQNPRVDPTIGLRSAIRAGDVLKIIDLIPAATASPALDNLRTFYVLETMYDAGRDVVTIVPDRPPNRLDVMLARQGLEAAL